MTSEYSAIYTDDSNDDDMIALAAVFREQIYYLRLPSASSIFNVATRFFINFHYFQNEMILSFTTLNCQPGRKRIMNLLSSEEATKVKARKIALTSALKMYPWEHSRRQGSQGRIE
jgi:hypothetical protein